MTYTVWGDSISQGYSPFLAARLGEEGYVFRPYGDNCEDSRKLLSHAEAEFAAGNITQDLLVVNAGLHDIKRYPGAAGCQVEPEAYALNLDALFTLAARAGARVLFVNTTWVADELHNARCGEFRRFDSDVRRLNEIAAAVCEQHGVPLADLYAYTKSYGPGEFVDHVHYTPGMSRLQAAFIAAHILRGDV